MSTQNQSTVVFPDVQWVESWMNVVNGDEQIQRLGKFFMANMMLEFGAKQYIFTIHAGKILGYIEDPIWDKKWDFAVRASLETWQESIKPVPVPFYQDIFGMMWNHGMKVEGNVILAMQNIRVLKMMLAAMKRA